MNSLGDCRAEFSGWRCTHLYLVPIGVMDMEKKRWSYHLRSRTLLRGTRQLAALSLVENRSCNHSFLGVKERKVFLSFWSFSLQIRVISPQSPSNLFGERQKSERESKAGERIWVHGRKMK